MNTVSLSIFHNMKKVISSGLIAGIILFIISYGGLYFTIHFFPEVFVEYNNPLFYSSSGRDMLFYTHAFIISLALSFFWERFKGMFKGNFFVRGLEFGLIYSLVALLPVMWITFSSLDITFVMVASWFIYGLFQALVAGILFARINP
ncbi:MAG TPA: hypothetical protein VF145_04615 [Chitinophagaceae bacterium]